MPEVLTSHDPATGDAVTEVPIEDATSVHEAVERARQAHPAWARRSVDERIEALQDALDELVDQRTEVAQAITAEAGKPVPEALVADVMTTLEAGAFLDRHAEEILEPPAQRLDNALLKDRKSRIHREPVGVVGIIAPWNYPLAIPATQTLFALAAGNAVVLKPSELTPGVGEHWAQILAASDLPEGLFQLVQGPGDPTGQALVEAGPEVLSFTGSVPTGRAIQDASPPGTQTVLELGGNDPMLVLDDADLETSARGATWAAFTNAGQTCSAVERLYAHETRADALIERLGELADALRLGPGDGQEIDVGPMITEEAADRTLQHVQDALDKGAHLVAGGRRREELGSQFVEPTVLAEVPPEARVMQEETFGPVLPVARVADEEEALERANGSAYGLTASVWTTRPERGDRLARRLEAGTVTINDHAYTYAACETPWGGVKDSGRGHTHGRAGLEAVTRLKHVNHASPSRASPWWFPYDEDLRRMGDEGLAFLYGSKVEGLRSAGPLVRRLLGP